MEHPFVKDGGADADFDMANWICKTMNIAPESPTKTQQAEDW